MTIHDWSEFVKTQEEVYPQFMKEIALADLEVRKELERLSHQESMQSWHKSGIKALDHVPGVLLDKKKSLEEIIAKGLEKEEKENQKRTLADFRSEGLSITHPRDESAPRNQSKKSNENGLDDGPDDNGPEDEGPDDNGPKTPTPEKANHVEKIESKSENDILAERLARHREEMEAKRKVRSSWER